MEEIEVPTEHLHETLHHEAHHSSEFWITAVALSTAVLAAFAAVTALLSGYHANKAVIERVQESNKWSYYQSNSVKAAIIGGKIDTTKLLGKETLKKDQEKLDKYTKLKKDLLVVANKLGASAFEHFERHERLAQGVTMFQIAITIAAISVLTKLKSFWYLSLVTGAVGIGFLVYALTFTPEKEEQTGEGETAMRMIDRSFEKNPDARYALALL